jgi:hypothetical protein
MLGIALRHAPCLSLRPCIFLKGMRPVAYETTSHFDAPLAIFAGGRCGQASGQHWRSLAEETSKEMDPAKLTILVGKLCRALGERNERKFPVQYPFPAD